MGDTNCDLFKITGSSDLKRLDETHNVYPLQEINKTYYTRITANSMTLIDHMLTNSTEKIKTHGVIHVGMSDHSLSYLI